jgi:hypothetical protein
MSYTPPTGPATTLSRGIVKLAGDLSGTADLPTVPSLANKADVTHTHAAGDISSGTIAAIRLGSGTASSTTYLRGDGTWATPAGGFTDPTTTKGDLMVRGATATTRLPVGSDGQALVADAAQATGVKWAAVSDATAVKKAGDTMTGTLVAPSLQVTGGSLAAGKVLTSDATGNATWQAAPGSYNIVSKSANYTAVDHDYILMNNPSAPVTVTLPAAVKGAMVCVKKVAAGTNDITISPQSGSIDGAASDTISLQWQSKDYLSDGTNWYLI